MFDCRPGQPFQQGDFSSFSWRVVPFPTTLAIHPELHCNAFQLVVEKPIGPWSLPLVRSFRVLGGEMIIHPTKLHEFEAAQKEQPGIFKRLAAAGEETLEDCSNLLSKSSIAHLSNPKEQNLELDSDNCDEKISRSSKKGVDFSRESAGVWRCTVPLGSWVEGDCCRIFWRKP